ncbi:hypothetical protein SAMN05216303_104310 [Rhodoferax sp. OV413]|uniref:hypothetical protein n=1 Tax=Rhodoferax sp. OV413 TaxID=1855285 RepID=UPI00088E9C23|nr:hypothetical protein [Rhodoferax sp. OV413]SDP44721.1 hypothetical protein SAMN05216303_104310 [Rhodoferax sp. OV413]
MRWEKMGLVYGPDGSLPWAQSHAMIPTPVTLNSDVVRVFITCCDAQGISRPGYVDISAHDPLKVLRVSESPLLDIGQSGTFDENGVLACSVIKLDDGRMFMYYAGFELGTKIRYRLLTGLAVSTNNGETFERYSTTPILERTPDELFFRGGPCCLFEGGRFRLWYVAGSTWTNIDGKPMPVYEVRYAESTDGIHWPSKGCTQIEISDSDEHGFGRPYVSKKLDGSYQMHYSVRRRSLAAYRLGYATSPDGKSWQRQDEQLNLDVSPSGFDSDAIMYAVPFEMGGETYLFYNGNNFGSQGFAVARLETA